jgi:hypothetical protein
MVLITTVKSFIEIISRKYIHGKNWKIVNVYFMQFKLHQCGARVAQC